MRIRILLAAALIATSPIVALETDTQNPQQYFQQKGIKVNHWVLAKPNGHPITVLDLAKRLEMVFHRTYPQYAYNQEVRFMFFRNSWQDVLSEQIDNQLIIADAEEKQIAISDGDIRQEMETSFGPNVVETLDNMGLTFQEAWEMTRQDLIVQQMRGFMITRKAITSISPEKLRQAYEQYVADYELEDECEYQFLTIRHQNLELARQAAQAAQKLIDGGASDLQAVYDRLSDLRDSGELAGSVNLRLSDPENRPFNSLADAYREVLAPLSPRSFSPPTEQASRSGSTAVRIFYLADRQVDSIPEFDDVSQELRDTLYTQAYLEEQDKYMGKLRRQYGIDEEYLASMIPENFEPFIF